MRQTWVIRAGGWVGALGLALGGALCTGQEQGVAVDTDTAKLAAEKWLGRALIVRGFPAGDELRYDSAARLTDKEKATDWTLSGFDLQKVMRRGSGEVELEGVRVAIRYNAEQHAFERHALKEEPMRIVLTGVDGPQVSKALAAIFSVGIEASLQRSMPSYWSHYFIPSLPWPSDDLEGKTVVGLGAAAAAAVVYPEIERKSEPGYTPEATRDRVHGTVQVKADVDAQGVPQRVVIRQPLGYGLDAKTAEAVAKYRFKPGLQNGVPAAMEVVVNQTFQ